MLSYSDFPRTRNHRYRQSAAAVYAKSLLFDLCGDDRDELVVWDYHWLYIYTQDDGERETSYHPVKYPIYNASNYRGEYSFPDASYITFSEDPSPIKSK